MSTNGRLRDDELAYIDEHTRLALAPARVWARAKAAAAREGVTLRATPSTVCPGIAGYRDLDMQRWLIAHPTGPAPIAPLGASTHGYGTVVDVDRGLSWLRDHGGEYGLVFDTIRDEPWHVLIHPPAWASLDPAPIEQGDDAMPYAGIFRRLAPNRQDGKPRSYLLSPQGAYHLPDTAQRERFEKVLGTKVIDCPDDLFIAYLVGFGLEQLASDNGQRSLAKFDRQRAGTWLRPE